jgi:predicted porin
MALRLGIITAALVLTVLSTGQALADDSVASDANGGFLVGDAGPSPADGDGSFWMDLRALFADATVSVDAAPRANDYSFGNDPGYNAFAHIDIDGFTVGGRFARWGQTSFSDADQQSYGVGASYRLNSWTVGIDWSRGNFDEGFLDVGSSDGSDVVAFTSSYALRPGVKINGLLEYSDDQPAQDRAAPGAFTVGIGTLINF